MKLGLLTSAGYLIPVKGLSARPLNTAGYFDDNTCQSPATSAFTEAFTPKEVKFPETTPLTPTPTIAPNNAAGEGRTRNHQVVTSPFPPTKQYRIVQQAALKSVHAGLPLANSMDLRRQESRAALHCAIRRTHPRSQRE